MCIFTDVTTHFYFIKFNMTRIAVFKESDTTSETTPLTRSTENSSKRHHIAISIYLLVLFGEAVEVVLPGVINQVVSCELGVSHFQEGVLGFVLFICFALSMAGIALWTGRFVQK